MTKNEIQNLSMYLYDLKELSSEITDELSWTSGIFESATMDELPELYDKISDLESHLGMLLSKISEIKIDLSLSL